MKAILFVTLLALTNLAAAPAKPDIVVFLSDDHGQLDSSPYHERPALELYDLKADPYEQHNLAADPAQAERVAELKSRLETWMREQGDQQTVFDKPRLLTDPQATEPNVKRAGK